MILLVCACVVCLVASFVQADNTFVFSLPQGQTPYQRTIEFSGQADSDINIYVENVYDPDRWKDWYIEIWLPASAPDLTAISVDYDNSPDHSDPIEIFSVPLATLAGPGPWGLDKGFYADTWNPLWDEYGTTPVGSGGNHPWGNPAWVSFHFSIPDGTPFGVYIYDECIPEPATLGLLLVGGIVLLRRRTR
jgi:hypothetical protein